MISCGIDYSISSPAVCVHAAIGKEFVPSACKFLAIPPFKKRTPFEPVYGDSQYYMVENMGAKVFGIERMAHLAKTCMSFINAYGAEGYCIEGYSFGGNGQVFQLGENAGILKAELFKFGVKQHGTPTPAQVKKFAFDNAKGKGAAKKHQMVDRFHAEVGINLYDLFELPFCPIKHSMDKIPSPIDDIADAYFICKMHHNIMLEAQKA